MNTASDAGKCITAFPCSSKPPTRKQGDGGKIKQPLHHLIYHGFYQFICKNIQEGLARALTQPHIITSVSTDMNYASFAQSKCQHNHIFSYKESWPLKLPKKLQQGELLKQCSGKSGMFLHAVLTLGDSTSLGPQPSFIHMQSAHF